MADVRSNQLSFQDPVRLPPNDLGIPGLGIPVEQGRKAFDLTGDAVALDLGPQGLQLSRAPTVGTSMGTRLAQLSLMSGAAFHHPSSHHL